jgi:hypothetical protein
LPPDMSQENHCLCRRDLVLYLPMSSNRSVTRGRHRRRKILALLLLFHPALEGTIDAIGIAAFSRACLLKTAHSMQLEN